MTKNLKALEQEIHQACVKVQRRPSEIKVLLASKKVSVDRLKQVIDVGYNLFGENTAQELKSKVESLSQEIIEWHFIGHLQSNKVKDIIPYCELIHSIDRLSLAKEISKRSAALKKIQKVLIEVNTSGEKTKSGVTPELAQNLCEQIAELPNIKICGLMTVAINSDQSDQVRNCFKLLKELSLGLKKIPGVEMNELSMGMSQDFSTAIEEGATIIRIGSRVFGSRS